jgi:hypothetical protein
MGMKGWIAKKMMAAMREVNEAEHSVPRVATGMDQMFNGSSPAIVAFRIENGYVVRTIHHSDAYEGARVGGFTYCKDHIEIANHIISDEAKRKLGVQGELFGQSVGQALQNKLGQQTKQYKSY